MWGSLILDTYNHYDLNTSFNNQTNSVILYLIKWQYFWWFWFSYLFILYYILFTNLILNNTIKFNMQLVTSKKARGKWGDLIICFLPLFWCINILTNSNSLLKELEWQTESSILTIRVRGKQWYWLYKLNWKDISNLTNCKLNISDKYIKLKKKNNLDLLNFKKNYFFKKNFSYKKIKKNYLINYKNNFNYFYIIDNNLYKSFYKNKNNLKYISTSINTLNYLFSKQRTNNEELLLFNKFNYNYNNKLILKKDFYLINFKWNLDVRENFRRRWFSLKQEPFKLYKNNYKQSYYYSTKNINSSLINDFNSIPGLNLVKITNFNKLLNNRLLNTTNTIVLPSNIPLTIITNSFDVVHSWFIPGLGLKMDCVPGRSTHHSLRVDTNGIYVGQCAEICGRFHHHMPIKVCFVSVEHYILWYNHFLYKNNISNVHVKH